MSAHTARKPELPKGLPSLSSLQASFFFSFQFCTLLFSNLCDQRPVTFITLLFKRYIQELALKSLPTIQENGTLRHCPLRTWGFSWNFQEYHLDRVQLVCIGILGMGQVWRTKQCLRLWAGLLFRRHVQLIWRHRFPSIKVRAWERRLDS